MRLFNEQDLLDENYRKNVIEEIEGNENIDRKNGMKKRYEVYKDNTKEYVLAMMEDESQDKKVTKEIIHRLANVSFAKKMIDKKAMVYKDGVKREVVKGSESVQEQIDFISDYVKFNGIMKKVNKYSELFKNGVVSVLPYKCPTTGKYYYKPVVLMPYLYDAIEDYEDPEIPRAIITSYFTNQMNASMYASENMSGVREVGEGTVQPFRSGDGQDQTIADSPSDQGMEKKEYIWWSNLYHFTTDEKGKIIPGKQEEDLANPIGELPFYNFAKDQDGSFWAVGGEDITDGAILLNMLLTDLFYIAKYQGMGIGYLFGKGVPKNQRVGASSFVTMEVEEGDPTPQIGFASSNPPIQAHLDMVKNYIAYLLSTNKLEPGSISGDLNPTNAASGVHEIIKRAENIDDIQDQREIYRDGEPTIFRLMAKWHNLYLERKQLKADLMALGKIDEAAKIKIRFPEPQPYISEKEKLENIKLRKEVGLDSMVDAIMKDNPELSNKEAEEKLAKVLEEKLAESSKKLRMFATEEKEKMESGEDKDIEEEKKEDEE